MAESVVKRQKPMLYDGQPSTFPTYADQVYGPDGEPLAKDGKWNLPVQDGVVPDTRKINGHALDNDIDLDANDVHARADDWLPKLEEIGGTWKAGDSFTIVTNEYDIYGFITSDATVLHLHINVGKPISASGITVKSFTAVLRGVSGYLDSNSENVDLLKSPYTIATSIASSRKQLGVIRINITKSSKFTNTINNTPIIVVPINLTIEFT